MSQAIQDFLSRHARLFQEGRLAELAEHYTHPLAVFRDGKIQLRQSPRETTSVLFEQQANVLQLGTKRLSFRYAEGNEAETGRFPVLVEWVMLAANGQEITRVPVRYYLARHSDGLLKIEMLEILEDPANLLSQNIYWRTEQ